MKRNKYLFTLALLSITLVGCKSKSKPTENNELPSHTHSWANPTYTWSDDNSTCRAERVCELNSSHVESETVNATYEVITPVSEENDGLARYIATFENTAFASQQKDVVIDKTSLRYVVTWQNYDGHVLEVDDVLPGDVPSYDGAKPTRDEDEQYIYTFKGWDKEFLPVHSNIVFTAQYSLSNTVVWKNPNGDVLKTDYKVENGTMPSYDGETPTYNVDDSKVCIFKGWSPEISSVTSDQEYTAVYDEYSVTFDKLKLTYVENYDLYVALPLSTSIEGTVVIPGSHEGKKVSFCGFEGCTGITKVVVSNKADFWETSSDYYNGFCGCTNLETVIFEASSIIKTMSRYAFYNCTSLSSINLPENLETIGSVAFRNCNTLEEIVLPDSLATINYGAFSGCSSLKEITIGENVVEMGASVFEECTSLETAVLPDGLEEIKKDSFIRCSSLTTVKLPNNLITLGESAFQECSSLVEADLPESLKIIGDRAFNGCTNLDNVVIPSSVTYIGTNAFKNCPNVTTVVIPDTVEFIACDSFDTNYITYHATYGIGQYLGNSNNSHYALVKLVNDYFNTLNVHPDCKVIAYRLSAQWPLSYVNFNDGLKIICDHAFYMTSLTSVTIPSSVKRIESCAFCENWHLESIEFEANSELTHLGKDAFSYSDELKNIVLPNSLKDLSMGALQYNPKLESVVLPNQLETIGESAFSHCTSLKSITIPNTVRSIGDRAFIWCTSLSNITFNGTRDQWNKVTTGNAWYTGEGGTNVIHCSDGDAELVPYNN